jgi:predicted ATPase/class 3 adenylate cyclase
MQACPAVKTFLFTDIEGSTRLWEEESERMRPALARHDALLRAAVESHRGTVVKMIGDGVYAAFDDPLPALDAALTIQHALVDPSATNGVALRVRCGLHLGAVERRDNDYFGSPVNRAARIMSAAHGGQVLLSQAVADRVSGCLPSGSSLRDLGRVRLKDLATPEHVFQLAHPELRAEFPALRSLEATPNNLLQQVSSFIGRDHELAEVKRLLAEARLLTLRGAGGVGKTRLALQVAADVIDEYPDGVWFVDLASIADPVLVPGAVAQTLGVKPDRSESLTSTLCSYLNPLRLLLILDNCEHLIDACARLTESLLRAAPNLRVLATSREALKVAGEHTYRLPPLSLPDASENLESLSRSDAVRLFVERARLHRQDFALTAERASAVAELCIRLDGIPLALELAAARLDVLPVEKIAERLNDRFRLLTGSSRTALPRQQTLRALVAWSVDLLSEIEKTFFARLSVFAGGLTLEAAEAVGARDGIGKDDVLDLLSSLVDKSLVMVDETGQRYRLLETIRQFARERLRAAGDEPAIRDRHFSYYLALVEQAEPALKGGPRQKHAFDMLEADHDNLRSALAWALEIPERTEAAVRMCSRVYRFWQYRGYWEEGYTWCMKALAQAPDGGDKAARAKTLLAAGSLLNTRPLLEEALSVSREAGDRHTEAATLNNLGKLLMQSGAAVSRARSLVEEARVINRELGNRVWELMNVTVLVFCYRLQGDHAAALALAEDGLARSRALNIRMLEASFVGLLAGVALDRNDFVAAQDLYEQGLRVSREAGAIFLEATILSELAALAVMHGDTSSAHSLVGEAFGIYRKGGDTGLEISFCFDVTAALASEAREHIEAARLSGVADRLRGFALPLDPFHRDRMASYRARDREALGAAAYDAANNEGRALGRDAAIREAMAWLACRH